MNWTVFKSMADLSVRQLKSEYQTFAIIPMCWLLNRFASSSPFGFTITHANVWTQNSIHDLSFLILFPPKSTHPQGTASAELHLCNVATVNTTDWSRSLRMIRFYVSLWRTQKSRVKRRWTFSRLRVMWAVSLLLSSLTHEIRDIAVIGHSSQSHHRVLLVLSWNLYSPGSIIENDSANRYHECGTICQSTS